VTVTPPGTSEGHLCPPPTAIAQLTRDCHSCGCCPGWALGTEFLPLETATVLGEEMSGPGSGREMGIWKEERGRGSGWGRGGGEVLSLAQEVTWEGVRQHLEGSPSESRVGISGRARCHLGAGSQGGGQLLTWRLSEVAHTCNPSTPEAEAGRSQVLG
jgi:hypothetical protein